MHIKELKKQSAVIYQQGDQRLKAVAASLSFPLLLLTGKIYILIQPLSHSEISSSALEKPNYSHLLDFTQKSTLKNLFNQPRTKFQASISQRNRPVPDRNPDVLLALNTGAVRGKQQPGNFGSVHPVLWSIVNGKWLNITEMSGTGKLVDIMKSLEIIERCVIDHNEGVGVVGDGGGGYREAVGVSVEKEAVAEMGGVEKIGFEKVGGGMRSPAPNETNDSNDGDDEASEKWEVRSDNGFRSEDEMRDEGDGTKDGKDTQPADGEMIDDDGDDHNGGNEEEGRGQGERNEGENTQQPDEGGEKGDEESDGGREDEDSEERDGEKTKKKKGPAQEEIDEAVAKIVRNSFLASFSICWIYFAD